MSVPEIFLLFFIQLLIIGFVDRVFFSHWKFKECHCYNSDTPVL